MRPGVYVRDVSGRLVPYRQSAMEPGRDRVEVRVHRPNGSVFTYRGVLKSYNLEIDAYHHGMGSEPGSERAVGGPIYQELEVVVALDHDYQGLEPPLRKKDPQDPRYQRSRQTRAEFIKSLQRKEQDNVEKFTATTFHEPRTKTVHVYLEDSEGKYLTPRGGGYERVERPMGGEMPLFATFPQEIWRALQNAEPA